MTGQCYYCAAREHHECADEGCTCCGERLKKFNEDTAKLVGIMQVFLQETGFYAKQPRNRQRQA